MPARATGTTSATIGLLIVLIAKEVMAAMVAITAMVMVTNMRMEATKTTNLTFDSAKASRSSMASMVMLAVKLALSGMVTKMVVVLIAPKSSMAAILAINIMEPMAILT